MSYPGMLFPRTGLSSWTISSTGFSFAHTAASRYPSSKSRSRTASSAGSSAQLKSWNDSIQNAHHLRILKIRIMLIHKIQEYLSGATSVFWIAVWTDPYPLQSQTTCWESTNTNLWSGKCLYILKHDNELKKIINLFHHIKTETKQPKCSADTMTCQVLLKFSYPEHTSFLLLYRFLSQIQDYPSSLLRCSKKVRIIFLAIYLS